MKRKPRLDVIANQLRRDALMMIARAGSGHPAGSLGMAEIMSVVYFDFAHVFPKKPQHPKRDYVILSHGHVCPILYAALAHRGFFSRRKLLALRKLGSPLQGHPHRTALPGLETTSGPLGSGLSQACGMALGLNQQKKTNRIICLTSDGEHNEGNTWEAVQCAAKYHLNRLIQIVDRNYIQIDGLTENVMPLGALEEKYRAFGWHTQQINGHHIEDIERALTLADQEPHRPSVIIAHTTPGKGVSFMEDTAEWHGKAPTPEQLNHALEEV